MLLLTLKEESVASSDLELEGSVSNYEVSSGEQSTQGT
jgi:hypothetical protein